MKRRLAGAGVVGLLVGLWVLWPGESEDPAELVRRELPPVSVREPPRVVREAPVRGEVEGAEEERLVVIPGSRRAPVVIPAARAIPKDEAWVWCAHEGALASGGLFAGALPGGEALVAQVNSSFLWMVVPPGEGEALLQGIDQGLLLELAWVGAEEGEAVACSVFEVVGEADELRVHVIDEGGVDVEGAMVRCGVGVARTGSDGRALCSLGAGAREVTATLSSWPEWAWLPRSGSVELSEEGEGEEGLVEEGEVEIVLGPAVLALPERVLSDEELRELDALTEEERLICEGGGDCSVYEALWAEAGPAHNARREQVMEEHDGEPPPLPVWEP